MLEDVMEPSDQERAGLPEDSAEYMIALEAEVERLQKRDNERTGMISDALCTEITRLKVIVERLAKEVARLKAAWIGSRTTTEID